MSGRMKEMGCGLIWQQRPGERETRRKEREAEIDGTGGKRQDSEV